MMDRSQGSGRNWLSSCLTGYESGRVGWMQPVATPTPKP